MFIELVTKRRSIRRYEDRPVEKEKIDLLVETVLRAPSSRGLNPWEFIVITDPELFERLAQAKPHGSTFLRKASLAFVICADPQVSDVWIEDAAIASIYLHLAAEALGIGSCWIQIRERMHNDKKSSEEYISETLGIPGNLKVLSIIAMGYPADKPSPHGKEILQYEKISYNRYGQKST
jgi:nitroreductase